MNIDEKLLLPIHEVLIKDMKLMLQRQHNELKVRFGVMTDEDRNGEIEMLVSSILHTTLLIKQNEDDKQLTHNPIYMGF